MIRLFCIGFLCADDDTGKKIDSTATLLLIRTKNCPSPALSSPRSTAAGSKWYSHASSVGFPHRNLSCPILAPFPFAAPKQLRDALLLLLQVSLLLLFARSCRAGAILLFVNNELSDRIIASSLKITGARALNPPRCQDVEWISKPPLPKVSGGSGGDGALPLLHRRTSLSGVSDRTRRLSAPKI